jgi:hypothetical protein
VAIGDGRYYPGHVAIRDGGSKNIVELRGGHRRKPHGDEYDDTALTRAGPR